MKENKKPILSICIPTRNRWYSLQHTLKSIMDQDEFKSGDVEIVISDNVSTDETEVEVGKLCKKYKNIRYFRNKENIGGNPNINKVISLGMGEYLWRLGSDDCILEGGLKNTLSIIDKENPDLILHKNVLVSGYNILECGNNDKTHLYFLFESQQDYFNYLGDQFKFDSRSFMYIENLMTFVSLICMKNTYYNKCIKAIKSSEWNDKFDNFYFSQIFVSHFEDVSNDIVIVNNPFISSVHESKIDEKKKKSSGYNYTKAIAKDVGDLYQYFIDKYKLNKNFCRLSKYSALYWYFCIIHSFLGKLFGKKLIKLLTKIYHQLLG